jgi:hypothetical protein
MSVVGPKTVGILAAALCTSFTLLTSAASAEDHPAADAGNRHVAVVTEALPRTTWFGSIVKFAGQLVLTGETPTRIPDRQGPCVAARLDPTTLRVGAAQASDLCNVTIASGQRVGFEETLIDHNSLVQLTEVQRAPGTGRLSVGPVLTTFAQCAGCGPQSAAGGGWLWIFDDGANTQVPTVLQISESSGQLVDSMPLAVPFSQPVMAANAEGLWIGPSPESGWSGAPPATLYRIAPGAKTATVVLPGPADVCWLVAQSSTLWAGTGRANSGCAGQSVVRIDGIGPTPVFSTPDRHNPLAVIGGSAGLWTVLPNRQSGPTESIVIRIAPETGRATVMARIPTLILGVDGELFDPGEATTSHGTLFVLGEPVVGEGYRDLFRISPG